MHVIIDCGHGGFSEGRYNTFPNKMYTFTNHNFTIHEGTINRMIGTKLAIKLKEANLPFSFANHKEYDNSLHSRCKHEHLVYDENNGNTLFLSIHSNSSQASTKGEGG